MSRGLASLAFGICIALCGAPALAQDSDDEIAEELKCGAAGDACQSAEWQAYNEAVAKAYPDWPEIAFRTYAAECVQASDAMKRTCLNNPKKAVAAFGLDQ